MTWISHTLSFSGEVDPKERLARQRKLLQRKLGLDMGAALGMDTQELFNDADLDCAQHHSMVAAGSSSCNHAVSLWVCGFGTKCARRARKASKVER